MATMYSHAIVGVGMARLYTGRPMPWAYWGLAAVLPLIPDVDVFSMAAYGSSLGHRGVSHSLVFAAVVGLAAATATFRTFRVPWWSLAVLFFTIVASHGVLDALTRGGEGIPLFWPLPGRYGDYGPLPLSDIAFDLPNPWRSRAIRMEMLWVWLPTIVVAGSVTTWRALRRREPSTPSIGD
jgi:inner membrane protein